MFIYIYMTFGINVQIQIFSNMLAYTHMYVCMYIYLLRIKEYIV